MFVNRNLWGRLPCGDWYGGKAEQAVNDVKKKKGTKMVHYSEIIDSAIPLKYFNLQKKQFSG